MSDSLMSDFKTMMHTPIHISPRWSWSSPTLLMSDLHLGRGEADLPILERIERAAGLGGGGVRIVDSVTDPTQSVASTIVRRVVLVGDLFDFNLGYRETVFRRHLPLLFCLERLRRAGVEVIVFTGNHDPDPSPVLSEELGVCVVTEPTPVELYGRLVLIEHGDLLEPRWSKRALCELVRRRWVRALARLVPPALTWRLTGQYIETDKRDSSRMHVNDDHTPLEPLIRTRWSALNAQGYHHWVFGHFHQAIAWTPLREDCGDSTVYVLGEQTKLKTCLYWDDQGPRLCIPAQTNEHESRRCPDLSLRIYRG